MEIPLLVTAKSTIKRSALVWFLLASLGPPGIGQIQARKSIPPIEEDLKLTLFSELQSLAAQATNLASPLARARANAEIADALWGLDEERAKEILTEAYKWIFAEKSASGLNEILTRKGSIYTDQARRDIRNRILQVAARDSVFARNLMKLKAENSDKTQDHFDSAMLAKQAFDAGDYDAGKKYIIDALQADPTQTMAGLIIQELAKKDRVGADRLIVEYIGMLRKVPTSISEDWARVYFVLLQLVFPALTADQTLPAPGPAVMREYALYVVESLGSLERRAPGSLRKIRSLFLTAWSPVQLYAPELIPTFLSLESLSRRPGDTGLIPTMEEIVNSDKTTREKRLTHSLEDGFPDIPIIEAAARRGEFDKARRAISRMEDSEAKNQLIDLIDTREAVALASKGDMPNAERLALRLHDSSRILEAYASLIARWNKNTPQKILLGYRALDQLRRASNVPPPANASLPESFVLSGQEIDPRLWSLSKLFLIVASLDDDLAQAVLQETIAAANRTEVDSSQGRLGFDPNLFKEAVSENQLRANQAAATLTDPLRRIVAVAVISKWKVNKLTNSRLRATK
jgi:hypothetical protein